MNLNHNNTTFVIVTYKSELIIHECLKTLPEDYNKIIVENSGNADLKKDLEKTYKNLEVFISSNRGMGASNNFGIGKCNTDFAYVINPDVKFKNDTIKELINGMKMIDDFAIASPMCSDSKYPNYTPIKNLSNLTVEKILSVDRIDGYSMLINKNKFKDNIYFDENFFLYLENDDLCLKKKKKKENIYIITRSQIEHLGGKSSNIIHKEELEYSRNWHWMWSKFYFNKKHYGFFQALSKISINFLSSIIKYFFYLVLLNNYKKNIYKMRLAGAINSIMGKASWFRPNIKN